MGGPEAVVLGPAPAGPQRAVGVGRIAVKRAEGVTRLDQLYQEGCANIRLPRRHDGDGLEAVLINSSGGLTGGDRLAWRAEAGAGTRLTVTTQACEKIYRAATGRAEVALTLRAEPGAHLDWLPQETILFEGGALARSLEADLAADARLLAVEAVVLGRTARGETVTHGLLRDRWRVRRQGRLVFADELRLDGDIAAGVGRPPVLSGARAFASLLLVADDAAADLTALRAALGPSGGASAFDGMVFARVVAPDGQELRRVLTAAIEVLRGGAPCPRVWSC